MKKVCFMTEDVLHIHPICLKLMRLTCVFSSFCLKNGLSIIQYFNENSLGPVAKGEQGCRLDNAEGTFIAQKFEILSTFDCDSTMLVCQYVMA